MEITVNYVAVLVASVVSMIIGSIWYGPLFGKKYMKEMGMEEWSQEKRAEMQKGMWKTYLLQFIASFMTFYVLSHIMTMSAAYFGYPILHTGLITAFWVWIGFVVPQKLGDAIWGGKMSLFWLGSGSMLLILIAGGAIIGAW